MPLHRLNDLEKLSFNNVEHLGIDYVIYSLVPWCVRIEQECNAVFYPAGDVYLEFRLDSLLRGDLAARAAYYKSLFGMGTLTINEIRHREGLNPIGPIGDVNWMPLNIAPADELAGVPIADREAAQRRRGRSPCLRNICSGCSRTCRWPIRWARRRTRPAPWPWTRPVRVVRKEVRAVSAALCASPTICPGYATGASDSTASSVSTCSPP